ncbi:MAG: acyl-CoA dehydrogenase [Marmoricola sp.]|nr:acyl-CoA dehydrogenase [Marmoricola sp.]
MQDVVPFSMQLRASSEVTVHPYSGSRHEGFNETSKVEITASFYRGEFPLQELFRDVMAYLVADGTAEIQKSIISREILSKGGVSL